MVTTLQITSGRGPAECCWVVAQVLKLLLAAARSKGINAVVIHREQGIENNTLFSAVVQLESKQLASFTNEWVGTIKWIGMSQFRKMHKRKNWFIGISEIETNDAEFSINQGDLKYTAIRSGGPGGQHVNKVSTAIRITHSPTGLTLVASDQRSQLQNKKSALTRLKTLLQMKAMENKKKTVQSNWNNHNELQRGNPVKVFTGTDFKPKKEKKPFQNKRSALKQELHKTLGNDVS